MATEPRKIETAVRAASGPAQDFFVTSTIPCSESTFQGKAEGADDILMADAKAVSDAGAFAMVIEGVVEPVARKMTESIPTVTIGIGGSPACDGQILLFDDLMGINDWVPKFVRKFANLRQEIDRAASEYREAVLDGSFPAIEETYQVKQTK